MFQALCFRRGFSFSLTKALRQQLTYGIEAIPGEGAGRGARIRICRASTNTGESNTMKGVGVFLSKKPARPPGRPQAEELGGGYDSFVSVRRRQMAEEQPLVERNVGMPAECGPRPYQSFADDLVRSHFQLWQSSTRERLHHLRSQSRISSKSFIVECYWFYDARLCCRC